MLANSSMNMHNCLSLQAALARISFKGASCPESSYFSKYRNYEEKISKLSKDAKKIHQEDGRLNKSIKRYLDETQFAFEFDNEKSLHMTIKEALSQSVKGGHELDDDFIHPTYTSEDAHNIIKNGFDPKRISRTKFGPGVYFVMSKDCAFNYGTAKLKARCKGRCASFDGEFYENIKNQEVIGGLKKFISNGSYTQEKNEDCSSIIDEYVRNVLVNELGYDFGYVTDGRTSCMVAFNLDTISNIRHY